MADDDLLVVPFTDEGEPAAAGDDADDRVASVVARLLRRTQGFSGAPGDAMHAVAPTGSGHARPVLAVGVGASPISDDSLRTAARAVGRAAGGFRTVHTTLAQLGPDPARAVRAVTDGFLSGAYRLHSRADRPGASAGPDLCLLLPAAVTRRADVRRALAVALAIGDATTWVRRQVETPAGQLTPQAFARAIREEARRAGVTVRVWSPATLRTRGFGATVGVGSGSVHPPTVVELTSGTGRPQIGLAGKGITFDSGGLNLKRDPTEIRWMKSDMAAAAAVAAAVCAATSLGCDVNVRAVLPLAENAVSERSMRPGDVVTHPDGRTTEVLDTDSEGRLVLADAISYLARSGVEEVIDVGTLTDGGGVGHLMWGCWGNDRGLVDALVSVGESSGDQGWALPLRDEYRGLLASDIADVTNVARDVPDSGQMAATYLSTFADGVRWAHIDNGSTAYLDAPLDPWPRGATGSPTAALVDFLLSRKGSP